MEIKKSVSVIIPNYNGKHLLEQYLPFTLEAVHTAGITYEIIVVDDCSTDNSVDFIRVAYPEIILIVNTQKEGCSYSCNEGITLAQHELILLLNPDVKLAPGYFEHQWKYFSRWDTFGVMGQIMDMDGEQIQDAARVPKLIELKLTIAYFYYTTDDSNRLLTLYLSGANALIDAAKLKEIGGFFELFSPFHCGDMELCLRAWRLKWNCYYEHKAVCTRQVSANTQNYEKANRVKSINYRNLFYVHALHLNGIGLLGWFLQITLTDIVPNLLAGRFWIWASYKSLFLNRKAIKEYRQRIKKLMDDHETQTTVFDVVNKIRNSVKNKKLVRFKTGI